MVHVGIAFQAEQLRYPNAAGLAAATEIVAQQVDDHEVLRPVLFAALQFFGQRLILLRRAAPRPRTLDRPRLDPAVLNFDKTLGRQAQQGAASHFQIGRERRGAALAQRAIGAERIALVMAAEPLGQVDLITVTGLNVILNPGEGLSVLCLALFGRERLA